MTDKQKLERAKQRIKLTDQCPGCGQFGTMQWLGIDVNSFCYTGDPDSNVNVYCYFHEIFVHIGVVCCECGHVHHIDDDAVDSIRSRVVKEVFRK